MIRKRYTVTPAPIEDRRISVKDSDFGYGYDFNEVRDFILQYLSILYHPGKVI
ncbi:hypothetical protein [Chryseobacterium sp. Marseille-Q3244]|uniref:hypothetical protein n=1 Tax=Chryseobacterium sp. Marseille-Q3244 TaxID=2758092 RepID=UPI002024ADE6|nr:hypothetical protein [Chryseobacterium sp. Marseille-Q3244]